MKTNRSVSIRFHLSPLYEARNSGLLSMALLPPVKQHPNLPRPGEPPRVAPVFAAPPPPEPPAAQMLEVEASTARIRCHASLATLVPCCCVGREGVPCAAPLYAVGAALRVALGLP